MSMLGLKLVHVSKTGPRSRALETSSANLTPLNQECRHFGEILITGYTRSSHSDNSNRASNASIGGFFVIPDKLFLN